MTYTCKACCTKLIDFGVTLGNNQVLENINLHMHCGELTALIGPNGAGKTTLLRAMVGELPHSGTVQFLPVGKAPQDTPRIGYVPQKLDIDLTSPLSVLDLFSAAASRWPLWFGYRQPLVRQAIYSLSAVDSAHLLRTKVGCLSGGELQRVLLALALTPVPEILLLDEPVSGIDQAGTTLFYQMISHFRQKYDLSIMLISHDLAAVAQVADRLIFLNQRVLCDGPPQEVLSNKLVTDAFGLDLAARKFIQIKQASNHHLGPTSDNS
jgi:zinc transport system ATP-binding protein